MATKTSTTVDIFGLTEWNEMIKVASAVPPPALVGGTIFYIDDAADGVYEFFDSDGNVIESVGVGDKPYAYKIVTPGTTDKYYVYHDELYEGRWTYYKNGSYVEEALGASGVGIGSGKTNTEIVMTKDNGAYIAADANGYPTIWYQLQQVRNAKVGGCDDWFVPSSGESEELRKAIGFQTVPDTAAPVILPAGKVTGGVIAGTADGQAHYVTNNGLEVHICYPSATKFLDTYMWSSSESSSYAFYWNLFGQNWSTGYGKKEAFSVFFTRAF